MFYSTRGVGREVALLFLIPSCILLCAARCAPAHRRAHVGIRPRLPKTTITTMLLPHHHRPPVTYRLHRRCLGRTAPIPPLLFLLLLLFSLLCSAKAQSFGSSSRNPYGNQRPGFGAALGIIVVILITAFLIIVFFSIYLRQRNERYDPSVRPGRAAGRILQGVRSRRSAARGLDPAVVQAFPTLVYAEVKEHKIGKGALECAVCLSEFEDDEALRLLPLCDHVFHIDCIDAWLSSHTTCPVCRCNLAAPDLNATEASTASLPADAGTSSTAAISEEADQREGGAGGVQPQEHVAITVEEREAGHSLRRMESKSRPRWRWSRSLPRFPRSHSTGHSVGVVRPIEDCERYTLRLPDHIRRGVMAGKFQRSSSCAAGEGSSTRKGHQAGEEGPSSSARGAAGGRSFKLRRWEWAAKSDRWVFFPRTLSMVVPRGDDGGTGGDRREG